MYKVGSPSFGCSSTLYYLDEVRSDNAKNDFAQEEGQAFNFPSIDPSKSNNNLPASSLDVFFLQKLIALFGFGASSRENLMDTSLEYVMDREEFLDKLRIPSKSLLGTLYPKYIDGI